MGLILPSMLCEENTILSEVWQLEQWQVLCTSLRVCSYILRMNFPGSFHFMAAGVKPALAAATIVSGMAGIWSYVKKSVWWPICIYNLNFSPCSGSGSLAICERVAKIVYESWLVHHDWRIYYPNVWLVGWSLIWGRWSGSLPEL